jgi:hypothetical protein
MTSYTIRRLYNKVKDGYILVNKTMYNVMLGNTIQLSGHFIHYSHYGSSAIRCNFKDFTWLLTTIFKDERLTAIDIKTYNRLHTLSLTSDVVI